MAGGRDGAGYDFGRARVAAGLFCIGLAGIVLLIATMRDRPVDSIQLGLLLGTGLLFLGVEAGKRLIGGGG